MLKVNAMNFIDNRKWLNTHFRPVAEMVREWADREPTGDVIVEPAKTGVLTLKVNDQGKMKYVHSKYDPLKEVDRILKQVSEDSLKVTVFLGIGLGYHLNQFVKDYPSRKFIIIEPKEEVFVHYLQHSQLFNYPINNVKGIHVGVSDIEHVLNKLVYEYNAQIDLIALPFYEKLYLKEIDSMNQTKIDVLQSKKSGLTADLAFQYRWTLNSLKNFPSVMKTPNFLMNEQKEKFRGKAAILVAAGPSLNLEYENLRKIVKDDLAYVFAVGSAINALLEEEIIPHAFVSYDPKSVNYLVAEKAKERNQENLPLIFGTSIGYETIVDYPGELYHFHTVQDHFSPFVLNQEVPTVNDAPTIAAVTLQILLKLGFEKIVFVGQNLAFSGDYRHAKGIDYEGYQPKITEAEEKDILYTLDVEGNEIKTDDSFNSMRQQIEMYIHSVKQANLPVDFINTTQGGAVIKGTSYERLEKLIATNYFETVDLNVLFPKANKYDLKKVEDNLELLASKQQQLVKDIERAFDELKNIQQLQQLRKLNQLEHAFGQFDKVFSKIESNPYYHTLLKSALRVQFDQLAEAIGLVKYETHLDKKATVILVSFNTYLNQVYQANLVLYPEFEEMMKCVRGE